MAVLCAEQRERAALGGGDDYELCFTVAPESLAGVQDIARALALTVTPIGVIAEGSGLTLSRAGEAIELGSNAYSHF